MSAVLSPAQLARLEQRFAALRTLFDGLPCRPPPVGTCILVTNGSGPFSLPAVQLRRAFFEALGAELAPDTWSEIEAIVAAGGAPLVLVVDDEFVSVEPARFVPLAAGGAS